MNLLVESIIVGFVIVIMCIIITLPIRHFLKVDLPPVCSEWNKNHIMEISLFLTGFFTHILFEYIGANKQYCENYVKNKI